MKRAQNTDMVFDVMPALMPHVRQGRMRALAVGSAQRVTFVPRPEAVPGKAELIRDEQIDAQAGYGMVSPANLPRPVPETVHASITDGVSPPRFRRPTDAAGLPVGDGSDAGDVS